MVTLFVTTSGCLGNGAHFSSDYDGSDENSTGILDIFINIESNNNSSWKIYIPIPKFNASSTFPTSIKELIQNNSRFRLIEFESKNYLELNGNGNDTIIIFNSSRYGERISPEISFSSSKLIIESDDNVKLFFGIRYIIRTCPDTASISFIPNLNESADGSILEGWNDNTPFSRSELIFEYSNRINPLKVISTLDEHCYKTS